jgi:hypothetical protein
MYCGRKEAKLWWIMGTKKMQGKEGNCKKEGSIFAWESRGYWTLC